MGKLCWLTDSFSQRVCVSIDGDGLSHEGREIGQELKKNAKSLQVHLPLVQVVAVLVSFGPHPPQAEGRS